MATFKKIVSKTGTISYQAEVRLTGYPHRYATFSKLGDAKGWARYIETEMKAGRYKYELLAEKRTVGELIQKYIDTVLEVKSDKPRYIATQRSQLLWWKRQIGKCALSNITPAIIGECRDELLAGKHGKKKAAGTVNRYLGTLSHVFTIAMKEWGWLNHNPIMRVRKPVEPRGRVRFLSEGELHVLLTTCKAEKRKPLYLIIVLAISTGARKMEIFNMKWKDVDLKRKSITLHETKNGERRSLCIEGFALELMQAHAKRHTQHGFVFPSADRKRPMCIDREWKRALKIAGITDFRFHDLRHTAASYLAMTNASTSVISDVLGHKTLNMVKRYAHLSREHTAEAVATMNKKLFGHLEEQA